MQLPSTSAEAATESLGTPRSKVARDAARTGIDLQLGRPDRRAIRSIGSMRFLPPRNPVLNTSRASITNVPN
jgi:hypothetical protein